MVSFTRSAHVPPVCSPHDSSDSGNEQKRLIDRAVAGDQKSFDRVVDLLGPVILARVRRHRLVRSAALSHLEEQDLVQCVWVECLREQARTLQRWDPARGALETFVRTVADRECTRHYRRARAHSRSFRYGFIELDEECTLQTLDASSLDRETLDSEVVSSRLKEAIPSEYHRMFALMLEGYSPTEIASILQVSRHVVYKWQHRIRLIVRSLCELP